MEKIIVDTREQKPLWTHNITRKKLDEGDYNTEKLINKIAIERKTLQDLYGSIIQQHKRFKNEINRAIQKNKKFYLIIQGTRQDFITKNFPGGYYLKLKTPILAKILTTIEKQNYIQFYWCKNTKEMRNTVKKIIQTETEHTQTTTQ